MREHVLETAWIHYVIPPGGEARVFFEEATGGQPSRSPLPADREVPLSSP